MAALLRRRLPSQRIGMGFAHEIMHGDGQAPNPLRVVLHMRFNKQTYVNREVLGLRQVPQVPKTPAPHRHHSAGNLALLCIIADRHGIHTQKYAALATTSTATKRTMGGRGILQQDR